MTLYEKALRTNWCSRFVARADDLNRPLTDQETKQEAKYQLETIEYSGMFNLDNAEDKKEYQKTIRQLKQLLK